MLPVMIVLLDVGVADQFEVYDNSYRVPSFNLMQEDINADPELVNLRRSERLVKPSSCVLSPFVVFKHLKKGQTRKRKTDDQKIAEIRSWYPSSGDVQLRLTTGGFVGPSFWSALLGDDNEGWLSDDHIFGWMIHLYESRDRNARWSILPPYFQMYFYGTTLPEQTYKGYYTGVVEPFPAITTVDEVYVPLLIPQTHWFLGVFNLVNRTLTVYDSLAESPFLDRGRDQVLTHINFVFDNWLRRHGYYTTMPIPLTYPFHVTFAHNVPQQTGPLGDCGVWVCIFLEKLINGKRINDGEDPNVTASNMRRHLAMLFYDSKLEGESSVEKIIQSVERNSDVTTPFH
ncbi:putative Ulp1 peptidase [Helianthus annuus]|nr:putative Ulp1 peptidase [Helianthus annuus]